jgi:hypothetical protein
MATVAHAWAAQILMDYRAIWGDDCTITVFPTLASVQRSKAASHLWPVVLMSDIGVAGASGVHQDSHGRPIALVDYDGSDSWHLTGSHEIIEMLTDPFGNRVLSGPSPMAGQGTVNFLVEPCDPSEADQFAYSVAGIRVSDFYHPAFLTGSGLGSFSHTGSLTEARQILKGGYLSWMVPNTREWWQATWFEGDQPAYRNLGASEARNPRRHTNSTRTPREFFAHTPIEPEESEKPALFAGAMVADQLQVDIDAIVGGVWK